MVWTTGCVVVLMACRVWMVCVSGELSVWTMVDASGEEPDGPGWIPRWWIDRWIDHERSGWLSTGFPRMGIGLTKA